ncbi:MAG: prepilin-type N-terminal cleavage/methylation domain-containing protein [Kiritimatiellales bacterium]
MNRRFQTLEKFRTVFPIPGKNPRTGSKVWNAGFPPFHLSTLPPRKAGLTLIEVLLAVVILGIGAGVLMLATARCLAVISKSRHYSTAQRLIQQVSAEHPLTRGMVEAGRDSGEFDNEENYSWEREITEPEDENREGLYTVRTRVSWSERGKASFEEVVTWVYIPPEEN